MALFRVGLVLHALASLGYWLVQPRGFDVATRSFLEHQVVAPALFAVSAAGVAASFLKRLQTVWAAVGILCGFWISSSALIAFLGTTLPSRGFWLVLPTCGGILVLAFRRTRSDPPALLTGGTVVGIVLAALFWFSTWAPPATTHPQGTRPSARPAGPEPYELEEDGIRVSIVDSTIRIKTAGRTAFLVPGFEYDSISDRGFWTIFDFRSSYLHGWRLCRPKEGRLAIDAENEDFRGLGEIWIENRAVHVRCETLVKREVASHLSSVMKLHILGDAGDATAVEGVPWRLDHRSERTEFVAIRNGRTELLRASRLEKGPFETLGSWELRDPLLTIDGWKVRVSGWADQGSPAPSPTAGWGVSQAAIERVDNVYMWSLASTSIGRGWHTVRTAPGVYVLEAVVTPP